MRHYRTAPDHELTGWPKGVPYIIGNEGCERFSFYGMKAILYVYLTHLLQSEGMLRAIAEKEATQVVHTFVAGVYALPMIGALIADRLLGKYNTIIWLSLVYCAGHFCLAVFDDNFAGFATGLVLIALGSGGIKPCVSAHVGDQFGRSNWHRLQKVYATFYFIINFGSMFSTLLIPWIKEAYGFGVAFAVPGVLMALATLFFWFGRTVFVHVPASPGGALGLLDVCAGTLLFLSVGLPMFGGSLLPAYAQLGVAMRLVISLVCVALGLLVFSWRQELEPDNGFLAVSLYALKAKFGTSEAHASDSKKGFWEPARQYFGEEAAEVPLTVLRIASVFVMVSVFWALFDQSASSWVEQARKMDRNVDLGFIKFEILPEQVQAVNPLIVMILVPLMAAYGYPFLEKLFRREMRPLLKMTLGMFVASLSFVIVALLQHRLDAGETLHVGWQVLAFFILTLAEVMVSVTGLEFAYTQAPKRIKSLIMGFWLFSIALGNILVVFLAGFQGLSWASFFWTFAGLMALAAVIFGVRARFYTYKTHTQ